MKSLFSILILVSFFFSYTGFAEVTHYCRMSCGVVDLSCSADKEGSCCNMERSMKDEGCCSTDVSYFKADLSPVVLAKAESRLLPVEIPVLQINCIAGIQSSDPYRSIVFSQPLIRHTLPDLHSVYCTFLI